MASQAAAQAIGSCGAPPLPPMQGSTFDVLPSICVAERYDSNVFYVPKTPGVERDDLVTTIAPSLRTSHSGEYGSGYLDLAGFGEAYVKNPTLNYIGAKATLSADLSKTVQRLLPNAKLIVTEAFTYTPLPPGFISPSAGTSPSDPSNIQNSFARGLAAFRTNNVTNNASVYGTYAITAATRAEASYSNAIIRFGSTPETQPGQAPVALFDTTSHTGTAGLSTQVTPLDVGTVKYTYSSSEIAGPSSAGATSQQQSFSTHTGTLGWSRKLTPTVQADVAGGLISISTGETTWAANAAIVVNMPNNVMTLAYSRSVFPSFLQEPIPLIGDTVSLSAVQKLSRDWQIGESGNWSRSEGGDGAQRLAFESYSASGNLTYWISQRWSAALNYTYFKFNQETGGIAFNFDRHVVMLGVRAMWR